jgi:branched-subunit amino acid transport protein
MGLVTYPSRALPLLLSRTERLPARVLDYLRLVGPAVLAALAATNALVSIETLPDGTRVPSFHVGLEWIAVGTCLALVVWRRNLLLGIVAAVGLVALVRAVGLA